VSDSHRPRAVLDSDIIYSRVLHDLMGQVARRLRLLDLFWSEELLAEARTTLEQKKQLSPDSAAVGRLSTAETSQAGVLTTTSLPHQTSPS